MEKRKRYLFILNLIISAFGIAFIAAAIGTEYWIVAYPERIVDDDVEEGANNVTDGELGDKFKGTFYAGLFSGQKTLDQGLGERSTSVKVRCENGDCWYADVIEADSAFGGGISTIQRSSSGQRIQVSSSNNSTPGGGDGNPSPPPDPIDVYFGQGLWVCVLLFAALAMGWGLVAVVFSAINCSFRPIETITGPLGLYIWNGVAGACATVAIILYVVLYVIDLNENVLTPADINNRWTSADRSAPGFSFYLLVVGTILFLVNLTVMALGGAECRRRKSFAATMTAKALDGTMMF